MFTIDSEGRITSYPLDKPPDLGVATDYRWQFMSKSDLGIIIDKEPAARTVKLWNQLPGVTPILTPKFRNKSTAIERIWGKLCELYPDAVPSEEMPKAQEKKRRAPKTKALVSPKTTARPQVGKALPNGTRSSAWATELTEALRKRFNPGEEFALEDVYKLIPVFQRRHKENHHIAARLRTTLAQDLRGQGVVKSLKRGKYRMLAA